MDSGFEPTDILDPAKVRLASADTGDRAMKARIERSLFETPMSPVRIAHFEIVGRIGAGGMGMVLEAVDTKLGRTVALKRVRGRASAVLRRRLLDEARSLAKLSHPNVIQIHEVLEHERSIYLAIEYVPGITLDEWQTREDCDWRDVLNVYIEAGRGLAAAHAKQIIHRDFKPHNVLVGKDGRVCVLDFGLAKAERHADTDVDLQSFTRDDTSEAEVEGSIPIGALTRPGAQLGTVEYMAPEQHRGAELDARADQFGFCMALWEGLFGSRPFTPADVGASTYDGVPREPPSSGRIPAWVRRAIERGLAPNPADRWPSMDELLLVLSHDPWVRRRRWGALLSLPAVGLAAWVGYKVDQVRTIEVCEGHGDAIHEVWNDRARTRLRRGFESTGVPSAPEIADAVMPWIDDYAQRWSTARVEVCQAAEFEGAEPELAALKVACLEERVIYLDAFLDVLSNPGEPGDDATLGVLAYAITAAASLPPVEWCLDEQRARARPRRPHDDGSRSEIERLTRVLATVKVMDIAGSYEAALQLVESAQADAKRLDWAPLQTSFIVSRGSLLGRLSEFHKSAQVLEEAFFHAFESGDDETAFSASAELAVVIGDQIGNQEDGLRWARIAESVLERARVPEGDIRRAELATSRGKVYARALALRDASTQFESALGVYEKLLGPEHPMLIDVLDELGVNYIQNGQFGEAESALERALAISGKSLGEQHPGKSRTLSYVAGLYGARGHYERAVEYAKTALQLQEDALGPNHVAVGTALVNLAAFHGQLGEYESAMKWLGRARTIYSRHFSDDHPKMGSVHQTLGHVYFGMGRYEQAVESFAKALQIFESKHSPESMLVYETLGYLGNSYNQMNEYGLALQHVQRAQALRQQALPAGHYRIGLGWAAIGSVHLNSGEYEQAIENDRKAVELLEREFGQSGPRLAWPLTEMGIALTKSGRSLEAISVLERALRIREANPSGPYNLASARFNLATTLWVDPAQRERARELAKLAHQAFVGMGNGFDGELAQIQEWLEQHTLETP